MFLMRRLPKATFSCWQNWTTPLKKKQNNNNVKAADGKCGQSVIKNRLKIEKHTWIHTDMPSIRAHFITSFRSHDGKGLHDDPAREWALWDQLWGLSRLQQHCCYFHKLSSAEVWRRTQHFISPLGKPINKQRVVPRHCFKDNNRSKRCTRRWTQDHVPKKRQRASVRSNIIYEKLH